MQRNKSFFDQENGLAEIELPSEYRSHFIRWSKKSADKLKASIEMKYNEYFLIIEEEDQKQYRMNISDLSKPANKGNLLISAPPYIDQNDLNKSLILIPFKANAKFENGNQREVEELSRGMKNLIQPIKRKFSESSENLERSENESDFFRPPAPLILRHNQPQTNQTQPNKNTIGYEYDKQTLRNHLIDFLKPKGDAGATLQEIKSNSKFNQLTDKQLQDSLRNIANPTKRQSKLYYILQSTFS